MVSKVAHWRNILGKSDCGIFSKNKDNLLVTRKYGPFWFDKVSGHRSYKFYMKEPIEEVNNQDQELISLERGR